jgi:hypothetical protein
MSTNYGPESGKRHVDDPRNYRVRLCRFGSHSQGDYTPSSLTVFVSATSRMQARMNAQSSHPGYTVTDVTDA